MNPKSITRLVLLMMAVPTVMPAREFTDAQGRKLEADLISVADSKATLRRKSDGREFTVAVSTFTAEDQKFINDFAAANFKANLAVTYTKKKVDETKTQSGATNIEREKWSYVLTLKNPVQAPLSDLRLDYWCFRRSDDGKGFEGATVASSGSQKISSLAGYGTFEFQADPVELTKSKLESGYYYINGSKKMASDVMAGFVVRVFQGEKEIYSYTTQEALLKLATGTPDSKTNSVKKR